MSFIVFMILFFTVVLGWFDIPHYIVVTKISM